MKLLNQDILNVFSGLNALSNEKFTAKLAWKIQTARVSLQPFAESVASAMDDVRRKFGLKDANGNFIPAKNDQGEDIPDTMQVAQQDVETLNNELLELLNVETEVTNVQLSISDFPDTFEISPNTLAALQPILQD